MPLRTDRSRLPLILAFLAVLATACTSGAVEQTPSPVTEVDASPSPTSFQPLSASPTPSEISWWISPTLPQRLQLQALALTEIGGRPVTVAPAGEGHLRVEAFPETALTSWIFALVAPFPTVEDSVTLSELRAVWSGQMGPVRRILVSAETQAALSPILGEASPTTIGVVDERELSERAWADRTTWVFLPFEDLNPTWKVLEVDGQSPVRREFDAGAYPLVVPFGVSGWSADPAILAEALGWPASNRDPSRLTVVLMTGVTAITRGVAWRMQLDGVGYPAERVGEWLRSADFTHVSQEISFTSECPEPDPYQPGLRFCGDPDHFPLLELVGVDLVELTGNHILDWGPQAFLGSLDLYHAAGMSTFGGGANLEEARQPVRVEHNGNRLAFLGCNAAGPIWALATADAPGGMPCNTEELEAILAGLRQEGYLPIFTFQWMEAYRDTPLPNQRAAFRRMIDAGAAIVSGSQAHQPQGYESYAGGWIHYGLGNLFFDQMWSEPTRQELLDRYVFYDGRHLSTEVLTAYLEDFAQPRPMSAEERAAFLERIFAASGW